MRKNLSRTGNKYPGIIIGCFIAFTAITDFGKQVFSDTELNYEKLITLLLISLAVYWLWEKIRNKRSYAFDRNFFYLVNEGIEVKVPLSNITKVYRPSVQKGQVTDNRVVEFINNTSSSQSARIRISGFKQEFEEFKDLVESPNNEADV